MIFNLQFWKSLGKRALVDCKDWYCSILLVKEVFRAHGGLWTESAPGTKSNLASAPGKDVISTPVGL